MTTCPDPDHLLRGFNNYKLEFHSMAAAHTEDTFWVKDPTTPKAITPSNLSDTLDERGRRYGAFVGHAAVTQELKRVVRGALSVRAKQLDDDQLEALEMILHKIGRIVNGDPDYADSWVDIAGYAKLVSDRLEGLVR